MRGSFTQWTDSRSDYEQMKEPIEGFKQAKPSLNALEQIAIQKNLVKHRLKDDYLVEVDDGDEKERIEKIVTALKQMNVTTWLSNENNKYMEQSRANNVGVVSEFFRNPLDLNGPSREYSKPLPECGVLHIKNMFDSTQVMTDLLNDFDQVTTNGEIEAIFDEQRHGKSHSIVGKGNMQILKKQTNSLNRIVRHLCDYFDLDAAEIRVNRYLHDEAKPAHQDAAAKFESKASDKQNVTVALSLGSGRPIRFDSIHSDVSVDLLNVEGGDVYVFPKMVNQSFTHQVCCANEFTDNPDSMRLSIIIWGKSTKLKTEMTKQNETLDEIRLKYPNMFDQVDMIRFGAESIEIDWNECYTVEYSMEATVAQFIETMLNVDTIDGLPNRPRTFIDKLRDLGEQLSFWEFDKPTEPNAQLTVLKAILSGCQLYLGYVTGDNNYLIIRSHFDNDQYIYAYCACKVQKKLSLSIVQDSNQKGNAGKKYVRCRNNSRDIYAKQFPNGKSNDKKCLVSCHINIWDEALDGVTSRPFYPPDPKRKLTCGTQCGKAPRLMPVPITDACFPATMGTDVVMTGKGGQLRWCCPGCLWIGPIYECKCVHYGLEEPKSMQKKDTKIENKNDSQYGSYVEYYACSDGRCYFTPKLYKIKLDTAFNRAKEDAIEQGKILSSLSEPGNTSADVSSDVLNNNSDTSSLDESDDDLTVKMDKLSVNETASTTSTLPFCACKLKMKLLPNNQAVCCNQSCNKTANIVDWVNVVKY